MTTLFISDLHLEDSRPDISRLFLDFLQGEAAQADALYILGDLFEVWIGDDAADETADRVAEALGAVAQTVPVYFIHGNRDFLLGRQFADRAGMTLMADSTVVDLYGTPTLLLHGDTLCTDDHNYQKFRARIRKPWIQRLILSLPRRVRLAMARRARDASRQHAGTASPEIMDVNAEAVRAAFDRAGVQHMIHGHTHRPAIHEEADGRRRIVLGDWYQHGSVLRVGPQVVELRTLESEAAQ